MMEESSSLDGKASPMDGKSERVGELVVVVVVDGGDGEVEEVAEDGVVVVLPMVAIWLMDWRKKAVDASQSQERDGGWTALTD